MGTPSDWTSGERVFAPPTGTFDVDWLVPAVVEAVPGASPSQARAALLHAWRERDVAAGQAPPDPLRQAASRVVDEARRTFHA